MRGVVQGFRASFSDRELEYKLLRNLLVGLAFRRSTPRRVPVR